MATWLRQRGWGGRRLVWQAMAMGMGMGLLLTLAGCGDGDEAGNGTAGDAATGRHVVATIWPLANLTRQLLPEAVAVEVLLPPGQTPHGFELTPGQMRTIGEARVLVSVGLSVDGWAEDAAGRFGDSLEHWRMAEAVLEEDNHPEANDAAHHAHTDHEHATEHEHGHADEHENDHADEHASHNDHDHTGVDPHLWLDPVLMRQAVADLSQHLIERFPEHAESINRRTADYIAQLEALDAAYRQRIGEIDRPRIATFHSAFDRLAARYGIEVVATLMPFDATGEVRLSRIEKVRRVIAEHDLSALFIEPQFADTAARAIQRNTGVALILLDPIGDPSEAKRDSYLKMMRFNLNQLLRGLTGS